MALTEEEQSFIDYAEASQGPSMENPIEAANRYQSTLPGQALHRGRRYAQRAVETAAGLPGDIAQTAGDISSLFPNVPQGIAQNPVGKIAEALPRSSDLRARSAEVSPELEPQSDFEQFEDEVVEDFTSLALPIGGKVPFFRSLGISLFGNVGKQGLKSLGLSENSQNLGKMGLMMFSSMFRKGGGIKTHINKLYKEAEAQVPQGATLTYPVKGLDRLENTLRQGSLNDAKRPVLELAEEIKSKISNGNMSVQDAVEFDRNINRAISRSGRDKTKKGWLKQLKKVHSQELDQYAKQNPTWAENWNEAKQAYKGIETSENIQSYIKNNINLKNIAHAGVLLGLEEAAIKGGTATKILGVGGTAGVLYAAEVAKRLASNPALRKYYTNVVKAALNENKTSLARNLAGLERVAKKDMEKNPFPNFEEEYPEQS